MKTTNPRALEVARELGCKAGQSNAAGTEWSVDCTEADFAEIIADLESAGPAKQNTVDHAALARLQSEGHGEPHFSDNTPAHPIGE